MARLFKYILSAVFLFASVPAVQAMDMKMDNMEEVKKKKKKKKKKGSKGKKKKKGFFSKAFGSKQSSSFSKSIKGYGDVPFFICLISINFTYN